MGARRLTGSAPVTSITVGHANPDFDAYASMVAATKLYEGTRAVYLGSQNANVREFHNLHQEFVPFVDLGELDFDAIERVIMVDTREADRIGEIGAVVTRPGVEVIVYDHHPRQPDDVTPSEDHSMMVGATTSILTHEIHDRGIALTPLEASVLLLGIHEDTGSLTYPGTTAYDVEAVTFLMQAGAEIDVLNQFLARSLTTGQRVMLGQLVDSLESWEVNGQEIAVCAARSEEYVDSAAVLTHYIVEDLGYRVAVALIEMPERLQIVGRSRLSSVDMAAVLKHLGGAVTRRPPPRRCAARRSKRRVSGSGRRSRWRWRPRSQPGRSRHHPCGGYRPAPRWTRQAGSWPPGATAACR